MRRLTVTLLTLGMLFALRTGGTLYAQDVSADVIAKISDALPDKTYADPQKDRHVLIYSKTLGFRHGSIPTGAKAFQMMGEKTRAFTAVHSEDPAMFDQDKLDQFDAIVMLNVTGDCLAPKNGELSDEEKATLETRKANLESFVKSGKGILGVHSATDAFYSWKTYGDMMGGWFTGHPWHTDVPLKIDAPNHPLTQMFDAENGFDIKDEIYQFAPRGQASFDGYQPYNRDKLKVLLSLNTAKFDVSAGARNDADYAISWCREFGDGRVFYSVLGHNDFIFFNPTVLKHYLAGMQYVLGDLKADASPSGTAPEAKSAKTKVIEPFNGKNLEGWKLKHAAGSNWAVGTAKMNADRKKELDFERGEGELVNRAGQGVDIFTAEAFGDCVIELELMLPEGSNSGIYVQGNYEIQVFDSWGKEKMEPVDIGSIYGASAALTNSCKAPGEWQSFYIDFTAAKFDGDQKVSNAKFNEVRLNGVVVQKDVEAAGPTPGNLGQPEGYGPLMFQGDHGPVAYRNIRITVADE
ncbi:MAG: ThuA domain-containing protein [Planctomycetales bacterium]|nr:ThuA domain-containing protein [Planctomycetales bacterium]